MKKGSPERRRKILSMKGNWRINREISMISYRIDFEWLVILIIFIHSSIRLIVSSKTCIQVIIFYHNSVILSVLILKIQAFYMITIRILRIFGWCYGEIMTIHDSMPSIWWQIRQNYLIFIDFHQKIIRLYLLSIRQIDFLRSF